MGMGGEEEREMKGKGVFVWGVLLVSCTHLWNGTGRRTVRIAAPLLLTSGPL